MFSTTFLIGQGIVFIGCLVLMFGLLVPLTSFLEKKLNKSKLAKPLYKAGMLISAIGTMVMLVGSL